LTALINQREFGDLTAHLRPQLLHVGAGWAVGTHVRVREAAARSQS
jgi:hypothetical protein